MRSIFQRFALAGSLVRKGATVNRLCLVWLLVWLFAGLAGSRNNDKQKHSAPWAQAVSSFAGLVC